MSGDLLIKYSTFCSQFVSHLVVDKLSPKNKLPKRKYNGNIIMGISWGIICKRLKGKVVLK